MAEGTCSVDGCDRPIKNKKRGWCHAHYMRWWYRGDVSPEIPIAITNRGKKLATGRSAHYLGDDVGYHGAHIRLRQLQGSASGYQCEHCDKPARHWAYNHQDPDERVAPDGLQYSVKAEYYLPLCVRCHARLDIEMVGRRGRKPPRTHCKRGHQMTPENIAVDSDGGRRCRQCRNAAKARFNQRRSAKRAQAKGG